MANQHVTHRKEARSWAIVGEGNSKATRLMPTQAAAEKIAKGIATNQGGDVIVHRKDNNQIESRNTYGKKDPFPPRG